MISRLLYCAFCFIHFKNEQVQYRKSHKLQAGSVAIVGSGPGDPDLLTVAALKALNNASLVVADRLVSQEILNLIYCKVIVANKKPGCAEKAQEQINAIVIEAVKNGERVVRLKIGDPFLFGRGAEEILEYRRHGIESKVIQGLSSAYSAPLAAGIPLTHRGVANQVIICTGYGQNGIHVSLPAYSRESTVVLLMAVGRIREITAEMQSIGYPPSTAVSIIECATTPQQRILRGKLVDIGDIAVVEHAKAPATIIVGEVNNVLSILQRNQS